MKSSQVKSNRVKSSQVKSSQVKSSQVKSSQVKSSQANPICREVLRIKDKKVIHNITVETYDARNSNI